MRRRGDREEAVIKPAAWIAAALALLLLAELAAVPVSERALSSSLGRCLAHDRLTVEDARRPVLPRLAVGRARDVAVTVEGLMIRDLRIDRARATVPEARLPWAPGGAADPTELELVLEASEHDLEAWLRRHAPLGVPVTVELSPDGARIGVEGLPFEVSLRVMVADGVLTLQPAGGDEAWWRSLGLATDLGLPDDVHVDRVELADARLISTLRVEVLPGLTDAGACEGPLAAPR